MSKHVLVAGAGISGLTVAFKLKSRGYKVTVVEKKSRVGGTIHTRRDHGFIADLGANSALETTPLINTLLKELGIVERRVYANERATKRYVVRGGKLKPLPTSPGEFLWSALFSPIDKLRLIGEPFVSSRSNERESVADFVTRRFGPGLLDYAVNPFVAGVYAGDPAKLSVKTAFPKLYALEQEHGSILRGSIRGRKAQREREATGDVAKNQARLLSCTDGMAAITESLAARLGKDLRFGCELVEIDKTRSEPAEWRATIAGEGETHTGVFDAIVLSVPAYAASPIVRRFDSQAADGLNNVVYPPVSVVFTAYESSQISQPLDGFGFLVPEKEHRQILGTIFSSTIFPGRSPDGVSALTTFVGGMRQPEVAEQTDDQLLETVNGEHTDLLGVTGKPTFNIIQRWPRAIPQYTTSHAQALNRVEELERRQAGLYFCANYRGGISVGDCIGNADGTAGSIEAFLGSHA